MTLGDSDGLSVGLGGSVELAEGFGELLGRRPDAAGNRAPSLELPDC